MNTINYFNPFSNEFSQASKDFERLSRFNQFLAVTASIFAGLLGLGVSAIAAFRFTVEILPKGEDKVAEKIDKVAKQSFPDVDGTSAADDVDGLPLQLHTAQVQTNGHPQPEPIDLELESVQSLIENVTVLAPNDHHPLKVEIDDSTYVIWYNPTFKSVNIQNEEDFKNSRPNNKLGISIQNDKIKVFYENNLLNSLDENKKALIESLFSKLNDIKMAKDAMDLEKKKFNIDSLKLLRSFFLGANGMAHTNNSALVVGEYMMWYRQIDEQPSRFEPSVRQLFILNIQKTDDYLNGRQANKLGISVNAKGEVESVYVDGQAIDPLELFNADHQWNKKLVEILNVFLQEKAVKKEFGSLTTHSVAIARQPEFVFNNVEQGQSFNFFDDSLDQQPGIDAGGLTRQFFSELALNLFDGASGRKIKVVSGIPKLSQEASFEENDFFMRIGSMLFYPSFFAHNYTLGRILDDTFFSALHFFFTNPNIDSEETLVNACEVLKSEEHPKWLFEVYKNPRQLSPEEKTFLVNILCVVDVAPTDLAEIKDVVKDTILNELNLADSARAAKLIAKGMLQAAGHQADGLRSTSAKDLSNAIQGIAINKDDIANRIYTHSWNPVIQQKTQWLKEYILESDEDEIRKFLITITGSPTVTAATQIRIDETQAHNCSAHTCFNSIDVPTHHTDVGTAATAVTPTNKEKFINNLRLTYAAAGFDIG